MSPNMLLVIVIMIIVIGVIFSIWLIDIGNKIDEWGYKRKKQEEHEYRMFKAHIERHERFMERLKNERGE